MNREGLPTVVRQSRLHWRLKETVRVISYKVDAISKICNRFLLLCSSVEAFTVMETATKVIRLKYVLSTTMEL